MDEPSAAEAAHFNARTHAHGQAARWLSTSSFMGLALIFGYFSFQTMSNGIGWLGIVLAVFAIAFLALLVLCSILISAEPKKLAAFMLEGPAVLDPLSGKHGLLVGDIPTEMPEYWRGAIGAEKVLRIRVVSLLDKSNRINASKAHPLQVVAIEGGPSIDFEYAHTPDRWPQWNYGFIYGVVYSGALGLALLGGTISHLNSQYGSWADTISALPALVSTPRIVFDGDALREAGSTRGPVSVEQGWVLPQQLVENIDSEVLQILVTDAARNRLLTDREDIASAWQEAWQAFEAASELFENTAPVKPQFDIIDGKLQITNSSDGPIRPQQPKVTKVTLEPSERVALEMRDPHAVHVPLKVDSVEPVIVNLEHRTEFSGIELRGGDALPIRLQPKTVVYDRLREALALPAGLFASAFALFCLSRLLRTKPTRQAFESRLRTAYTQIGVTI